MKHKLFVYSYCLKGIIFSLFLIFLMSCNLFSTKYDLSEEEIQYTSFDKLPNDIKNIFLRSYNVLSVHVDEKNGYVIEGNFINLDSTYLKVEYENTGHAGMWHGETHIIINDTIYNDADGKLGRFCIYRAGHLYYLIKDIKNYPHYDIELEELKNMKVAVVKLR